MKGKVFGQACLRLCLNAAVALMLALLSGVGAPAAAQDDRNAVVKARFGDHPGFSRVVFDWRRPTGYSVRAGASEILVDFNASNAIDLTQFAYRDPELIEAVVASTRGGKTRIALKTAANRQFRHFLVGTKVVIDVFAAALPVPEAEAASPAVKSNGEDSKPAAPAIQAKADAPIATPDDLVRLPMVTEATDGEAAVVAAIPAPAKVGAVSAGTTDVSDADTKAEVAPAGQAEKSEVDTKAEVAPAGQAETSEADTKAEVAPAGQAKTSDADTKAEVAPAGKAETSDAGTKAEVTPAGKSETSDAGTKAEVAPAGQAETSDADTKAEVARVGMAENPDADATAKPSSDAAKPLSEAAIPAEDVAPKPELEPTVATSSRAPSPEAEPRLPQDNAATVEAVEPEPKVPALSLAPVENASASEPQTRSADATSKQGLRLRLTEDDQKLVLSFTWPEPVAAAAFERAGYFWVIFDRYANLDLLGLGGGDGPLAAIEQMPNSRATVLRLQLRQGRFAAMTRKETVWRLIATANRGGPRANIVVLNQSDAAGVAKLFLPVIDTGERVHVDDPEVGDRLAVVPVLPSGHGVRANREFAELRVLASVQGVALLPRRDGLEVKPLRNGVSIGAEGGLALSSLETIRYARRNRVPAMTEPPLLALAEWRDDGGYGFQPRKHELQHAVATAPEAGRNVARWNLAKFLFANNFISDAHAALALMREQDAVAEADPAFRAMRGVVALQLGRVDEATIDLMRADLNGYWDIQLWRGALLVRRDNLVEANQVFASSSAELMQMPATWRRRFLFDWAEAAVAAEDEASFNVIEDLLSDLEIPTARRGQLEYLKGRAAEFRHEPDVAIDAYDAVMAGGARRARLRAAVARANLRLQTGAITPEQAVSELEAASHAWRGDRHEISLLARLADLRLEVKDYAASLSLMRRMVSLFPEDPATSIQAQRMNEIFTALFLDDQADGLSPVKALALFYEFQELTPVGAAGDEMIRKLADRLVQVDLLERAARLLEQQLNQRLKGAERARVGARLALIYLLDRRPKEALETLRRSKVRTLAAALQEERRHLEARALADLDRDGEALALLAGDNSRGAELLRSELAWRAQDWPAVAAVGARLLGERWQRPEPLSEEDAAQVIKRAVALNLGNELDALDRLKTHYEGLMETSPYKDTFRVLAHKVVPENTEFRQLAGAIAGIGDLEAFMSSYRARVAKHGLSTIN